jgi:hypothetical protein
VTLAFGNCMISEWTLALFLTSTRQHRTQNCVACLLAGLPGSVRGRTECSVGVSVAMSLQFHLFA